MESTKRFGFVLIESITMKGIVGKTHLIGGRYDCPRVSYERAVDCGVHGSMGMAPSLGVCYYCCDRIRQDMILSVKKPTTHKYI
jgi:hypothetical protein